MGPAASIGVSDHDGFGVSAQFLSRLRFHGIASGYFSARAVGGVGVA